MSTFAPYRKLAKQLVRWHETGNYSVGERVRRLERFGHLTDREILDQPLPLGVAQEVVATEAGYSSWAALKSAHSSADEGVPDSDEPSAPSTGQHSEPDRPARRAGVDLGPAVPILFVRDVSASIAWYARLGLSPTFHHGNPAFYAEVARGGARIHLRFVGRPNFVDLAAQEHSLILATIQTTDVKALYDELRVLDIDIAQPLTRQAWGGLDFHVRDPDGNTTSFVQ